jgi:spermidine synthase
MHPPAAPRRDTQLYLWLSLFVLSGVGGLIFQVIWTRKLALVLGSTVQSASLTSAAFMLGLGLGAYGGGSLAGRTAHPMRRFAVLELAVALLGLGTTMAIPLLPGFLTSLLGLQSGLYRPLLLLLAGLLLLLPALAMGATLPLLVSGQVRTAGGFVRVLSWFYAANTLGAAVGAFATDFLFVKALGVWGTACLAAGFDLTAALLAYLLFRLKRPSEAAPPPPQQHSTTTTKRLPLLLLALSGFCGLGLEIAWTRLLVFFNGTDIYAYSLVLSIYLLGIVVGSFLAGWLPRNWIGAPLLGLLFLLLALLAWQTVYTLGSVGNLIAALLGPESRFWRRILACLILVLPSTMILGAIFPVASSLVHQGSDQAGQSVGLAYVSNTVGSVLGALTAGFVLLAKHGLQATIQGFAAVATLAAVLAVTAGRPARQQAFTGLLAAGVLIAIWATVPNRLVPFLYERNGDTLLFAADDHYGAVALVDQLDPLEAHRYTNLIVDGYNMAGNNLESQRYTAQLGLLPALLAERPRNVLMVCLGVGNTLRALESLPGVERIDVVELSQTVVSAVSKMPDVKRALDSPKVSIHIGDGRYFLATTAQRYDVITAEPPPPTQAGIVNLYSREYYELCASRLEPAGVVAQWLPVMQMSQFEARTIIRAFQDVFPYSYLYQGARLQLVLVGSAQPLRPDLERVAAALPDDRDRLADVDLDQAEKLFAGYLSGPEELRAYTGQTPPLTDDRPYLQYHDANWAPDLAFLLKASAAPKAPMDMAAERTPRFDHARRRAWWRNRYHWERSSDEYLDKFRRLELARKLIQSADTTYDRITLGASSQHEAALTKTPPSWGREIDFARWAWLNDDPRRVTTALGEAEKLAGTPEQRSFVSACRILMQDKTLSPAQRRTLQDEVSQGPLSPTLRELVLKEPLQRPGP